MVPYSCCDSLACELAEQYAIRCWDVKLTPTGENAKLPFMGKAGCVVPPHLRPICTRHTCTINGIGCKVRGEGLEGWNKRYFELYNRLEELENELCELRTP